MARPGDWSPLGLGGDPTPGDPEVVDGIVRYMKLIQTAATDADNGINTIMSGTGDGAFIGRTADWLREEIESKTKTFLTAVSDAFETAAPAMSTYAQKLRDAQASADSALSQAQGLAEDDPKRETLAQQARDAQSDAETAAATASSAVDSVAHATNPWAKSACEQFWDAFFWIVLLITIVAIFVGGPLGLIAFALNAVLAIKEIVDFAQGNSSIGELLLSLVGVLFPSTRALKLGDLLKSIKGATAAIAKGSWAGLKGLAGGAWRFVNDLSMGGIYNNVKGFGNVVITAIKAGAAWIPKAVVGAGAFAHGFVALPKTTISAISNGFISNLSKLGGAGITKINAALDGFLNSKFVKLTVESLGGWQALRIVLPMAGHEIRGLGVLGAFKVGILGRGLGLNTFRNTTLIGKMGDTVQVVKGVTMLGGGVYDAWTKVMHPEIILPGGAAGAGADIPTLSKPILDMPPLSVTDVINRMPGVDSSFLRGPGGDFASVKVSPTTTIGDLNNGSWSVHTPDSAFSSNSSGIFTPNSSLSAVNDLAGGGAGRIGNVGGNITAPAAADLGGLNKLVLPENLGANGGGVLKIPGVMDSLGGATAIGSLKTVGQLDTLTRIGNISQIGDLNQVGGSVRLTDGNVTLNPGNLQITDGNFSINLGDLKIGAGDVNISLGELKLTDGVAAVSPAGLKVVSGGPSVTPVSVQAPGTSALGMDGLNGGIKFTDGAATVDMAKVQITDGTATIGLNDLKFTNGSVNLDLHGLKLTDGVNTVDLGSNLRLVDGAGGAVVGHGPVGGINGLADHLSTPAGLQGLLSVDATAAMNGMRNLFPGGGGHAISGNSAGLTGISPGGVGHGISSSGFDYGSLGQLRNADLHASLDDFMYREVPKVMDAIDEGATFIRKTDESIQFNLPRDIVPNGHAANGTGDIGMPGGAPDVHATPDGFVAPGSMDGAAGRAGQAARIDVPNARLDGGPTLNNVPVKTPKFETGGVHPEPKVAQIETPGVNRVEDALAQLADVDAPRPNLPDSISAHGSDIDGAGFSGAGARPDLAGGEISTPHGQTGEHLAVTPEGHAVDPTAPRADTPNPAAVGDEVAAPTPYRPDPLAEVKYLADRLFPGRTDVVVTYQAAQGLLNQAQLAKAAGLETGASADVLAQQIQDVVVAERLLAKAEQNLTDAGLNGAQVDAKMAKLDAGDTKFAEAGVEIDITAMKQIKAVEDAMQSGDLSRLRNDDLFRSDFEADPKIALGLDEADWRGLEKAYSDLKFSNSRVDAETLQASLDSLKIDSATWQKFLETRDLGPSSFDIKAFRDDLHFNPSATDDDIRKLIMESPGDRALREAITSDPSFQQFRDIFEGGFKDFLHRFGGDVDLGVDRLKFAQWQADPLRAGNLPPGMEAGDLGRIFRDRDTAVSLNQDLKNLPTNPGRELDPPGGISLDGLKKVWGDAVDKVRTGHQNMVNTPGASVSDLDVMFDDVLRDVLDGLPEAFARQARFEDELISNLSRFDDLVADTKVKAPWADDLATDVIDRAKANFAGELRGGFDKMLRDLDINLTNRVADQIDPKLQPMRDELFGSRGGDKGPDFRAEGDYHLRLDDLADAKNLEKAYSQDGFKNWATKVDEIRGNVPDRLRFESEAADALKDAGRRFHDMSDGTTIDPKMLDAIGSNFREKTAVAFHDAYEAGGSKRGWLDQEFRGGDAFGGGRSAQAEWRANDPWNSNLTDVAPAHAGPGHSAGSIETPDNAGGLKVEDTPDQAGGPSAADLPKAQPLESPTPKVDDVGAGNVQVQELVPAPKQAEIPSVKPVEVKADAGVQVPRPQVGQTPSESLFPSQKQLFDNPAAAIEHDVQVFETRFAEAGVPQAVTDAVLGNFRMQAQSLADLHRATGQTPDIAFKAGVPYAGASSAQVNLGFAYREMLREPQSWANFHLQVERSAKALEGQVHAKIDAADLSHLSPAEQMQIRVGALDSLQRGIDGVVGRLYGSPGSLTEKMYQADTQLAWVKSQVNHDLTESLSGPPPVPDVSLNVNAVDEWAGNLQAHADGRFGQIEVTPLRQDLLTQAQSDFSAGLGRAVDDLRGTPDIDLAGRLNQANENLLGTLKQGLTEAHVIPLSPGQLLDNVLDGRSDWGQTMIDSLPGSPILTKLEIVSFDGRTVVRPLDEQATPATGPSHEPVTQPILHVEPSATGQIPGLGQIADLVEALPPVLRPHDFVVHPSVPFTADELRFVLGAEPTGAMAEPFTFGRVEEVTETAGKHELTQLDVVFDNVRVHHDNLLRAAGDDASPVPVRPDRDYVQAMIDDLRANPVLGVRGNSSIALGREIFQRWAHQNGMPGYREGLLGGGKPKADAEITAEEEFAKFVIAHPGYASGDQFGVAATLLHNPEARVLLGLAEPNGANTQLVKAGDAIHDFFKAMGLGGRVDLKYVDDLSTFNATAKNELGVDFRAVSHGTYYLEKFAKNLGTDFKVALRTDLDSMAARAEGIADYLKGKGVDLHPDTEVLVLWSRYSGKKGEAHYEHDTSLFGVQQLLKGLQGSVPPGRQRVVVIAGDRHPSWGPQGTKASDHYQALGDTLRTGDFRVVDLTEFWKDTAGTSKLIDKAVASPKVADHLSDSTRVNQFGVYEHLHLNSNVQHLGFRSGNLEAFVLSGHNVTYLEELGSASTGRMQTWKNLDVNPSINRPHDPNRPMQYTLLVVKNPPTGGGQLYKLDELAIKPIANNIKLWRQELTPILKLADEGRLDDAAVKIQKFRDRLPPARKTPEGKPGPFEKVAGSLDGLYRPGEWMPDIKRLNADDKKLLATRFEDMANRLGWSRADGVWTLDKSSATFHTAEGLDATIGAMRAVDELIDPLTELKSAWVVKLRANHLSDPALESWRQVKAPFSGTRGFQTEDLKAIFDRLEGNWRSSDPGLAPLPGLSDGLSPSAPARTSVFEPPAPITRFDQHFVPGSAPHRLLDDLIPSASSSRVQGPDFELPAFRAGLDDTGDLSTWWGNQVGRANGVVDSLPGQLRTDLTELSRYLVFRSSGDGVRPPLMGMDARQARLELELVPVTTALIGANLRAGEGLTDELVRDVWRASAQAIDSLELRKPLGDLSGLEGKGKGKAAAGISLLDNVLDNLRKHHELMVKGAGDEVTVPPRPDRNYVQAALNKLIDQPVQGVHPGSTPDLGREIFRQWARENEMLGYQEGLPGKGPLAQDLNPDLHGESSAAGAARMDRPLGAKAQKPPGRDDAVLIQHPGYATGDQFGLLATLLHNPKARVALVHDLEDAGSAASIKKFYDATGVGERVRVLGADTMDEAKVAFKDYLKDLKQETPGKLLNEGVSYGTKYVSQYAPEFGAQFKEALKIDQASMAHRSPQIADWLRTKGVVLTPETDVLVLWSRFSGKKWQAHLEHDTSITGVRQLLSELGTDIPPGRQRVVVIAGDRHPGWGGQDSAKLPDHYASIAAEYSTADFKVADLTEFWKDPSTRPLLTPGPSRTRDTRVNQFGVYEHLHLNSQLQHLGFRSGNLEAFALSGHKVTYLEENASVSWYRMTQWEDLKVNPAVNPAYDPGRVTSYPRMELEQPPTRGGQLYKLDELALEPVKKLIEDSYKGLVDATRPGGPTELVQAITTFRDTPMQAPKGVTGVPAFQKLREGLDGIHQGSDWRPDVRRLSSLEKNALNADLVELGNRLGWFRDLDGTWQDLGRAAFTDPDDLQKTVDVLHRVKALVQPLQDYESTWALKIRADLMVKGEPNSWQAFKDAAVKDAARGFTPADVTKIMDRLRGNWGIESKGKQIAAFTSRWDASEGQLLGDLAETRVTFPELAPVNPLLAKGGDFATNCVIAFITFHIALREGGIFQAPPSGMWSNAELAAFQRQQLGLDDSAAPKVFRSNSLASIRASLLKAGEGSTAGLVFDVPGQGHGHVINVVTRNGRVWFLDAQSGGPAVLPHGVTEVEFWPMSTKIGDPAGSHAVAPGDLTELPGIAGRGDVKPKHEFGDFVIMHPGFATGDQFGILATLAHNPKAHVALLRPAPDGVDAYAYPLAKQVEAFYAAAGVMDRVKVVEVADFSTMTEATKAAFGDLPRMPVNFGTKYVAAFAKNFGTDFKSALKVDPTSMAGRSEPIRAWFSGKGIDLTPDTDVLVLWSRFSGKKGNAHLEHDTSLQGVEQILGKLGTGRVGSAGERLVVIAGDRHPDWGKAGHKPAGQYQITGDAYAAPGFKVVDLTEFWNDPGSHHLIKPGANPHLSTDARVNQLGLYEFLHQNANVQHLGFRSGNLEAFVLFGHQVTYLEENLSLSTGRMLQWKSMGVNEAINPEHDPGRIMSYSLMAMDQAPSRSGQLYKLDELALRTGADGALDTPGNVMSASSDLRAGLNDIIKAADQGRPAAEIADLITKFRDDPYRSRSGASEISRFEVFRNATPGLHGPSEWLPDVRRLSLDQKGALASSFEALANRLGWFREGAWRQDLSQASFASPEGLDATVELARQISELTEPLTAYRSGWAVKLRADLLSSQDVNAWSDLKADFARGFSAQDVVRVTDRVEANWSLQGPSSGSADQRLAGLPQRDGLLLGNAASVRVHFPELVRVNPWLFKGGEYATNCVISFITFHISIREGGTFQAPPSQMWSQAELANFQGQQLGLEDGAAPRVLRTDSLDSIRASMFRAGEGSQAALVFALPGQGFGHVVNVVTRDGQVWFLDAQAGGAAVLPYGVREFEFWPMSAHIADPAGSRPIALTELTSLGAGGLKPRDEFGSYVISHQGFATGDQFGLMATLKHNPNAQVALSRPAAGGVDGYAHSLAESIRSFYEATGVIGQVRVLDVENLGEFTGKVKEAFPGMKRHPLNFGTKYVAEFASQFGPGFKDALGIGQAAIAGRSAAIETWFAGKGLTLAPDTEVLVLWSRFSGKKGNAHLEHDTSLHGVEQMLEGLQKSAPTGKQRVVVIAGDRHPDWGTAGHKPSNHYQIVGNNHSSRGFQVVDLTEFWKDPSSHHLIRPGADSHLTSDPRVNQFGVYEFLHLNSRLQHLGFRSGNLEAFVLSGHHVTYLEENASFSSIRMRSWDDLGENKAVNPAYDPDRLMRYSLMEMQQAPTRSGQLYKLDELALTPIMDQVSQGYSGLARVVQSGDPQTALARFRDEKLPKQNVSQFDVLQDVLSGMHRDWRPDVRRLSSDEKAELGLKFGQLADRLARSDFGDPATVELAQRVGELIEPLTKYRSGWMTKLRADFLQAQDIDGWRALKEPFTKGFTGSDLGEVMGRLEANWSLTGPSSRRPLAGPGSLKGRVLGNDVQVRAHFGELASVNPLRHLGGEFSTNCVIASIAFSIALREGGRFQAPPSEMWSHIELMAWQKQQLGRPDRAAARVLRTDSLDPVRAAMLQAGEGAQAFLVFDVPGRGFGHVVNVVTRDGQVWFLDAQAGGAALVPTGVHHFEFWPLSAEIADPAGARALAPAELTPLSKVGAGSFELQTIEPARPLTEVAPAVLDTARSNAMLNGLRGIHDRLPMGLTELSAARMPLAAQVVQAQLLDALHGDATAVAFLAGLDRVNRLQDDGLGTQMQLLADRGAQSFDDAVTLVGPQNESLRGLAENLAWAPFVANRFDDVLRSADVDPQHERRMTEIAEQVEEQIDPLMRTGPENPDWARLATGASAALVPDLAEALVLVTMTRDLARLAESQDAVVLTATTRDVVDRLAVQQADQTATDAHLPVGFGEVTVFPVSGTGLVPGGRTFAFGPGGQAESFGGTGFTDAQFVAKATDFPMAPATLGALQGALTGYIAEFGATNAVRSMLEGGLDIGAAGHTLTLRLQGVDRARAQLVRPSRQPLLRSGEALAKPMDKLVARSTAISQEISRTGAFDVSVWTAIATQGPAVVVPYGGINATSVTTRAQGLTLDSGLAETIITDGPQAYFDLPAQLISEVRADGKRAVKHRDTQNEPLRVSFSQKQVAASPAPGEWILGSEHAPLTGALSTVMPGFGPISGLGFLNRALAQALSLAKGSDLARVIEHRTTETVVRADLPRALGSRISQPSVPWTKGRSLVTHTGAEVLAARRLGPPVEVPVQLDKGGSSSQFSTQGNGGTFGFTAGVGVTAAPLGKVSPMVTVGFPLGTGRGATVKNGLAAGSGVKMSISGKSVPYQLQVRYTMSGEAITTAKAENGELAANLKADLGVTVYVAEELAPLFERALHEAARLPLPALPEPAQTVRQAPPALSKPTGPAGFTETLGLTGTQNLVRQFSGLLGQVEQGVPVDRWTRSQQVDLQDWLIGRFGEPDLRQGQETMFSEDGRTETYVRELESGDVQHITFEIGARRSSSVPTDATRVEDVSIELKPSSAFENVHSGTDTTTTGVAVGTRWTWNVPIPGTNRKFTGRLAMGSSATRGHTDTVDVQHSGSVTKPLAYSGPAWLYRYPSEVTLKVSVTRVLSRDLSSRIVHALESGGRKMARRLAPELEGSTQARFGALAGWLVPEPLTSLAPRTLPSPSGRAGSEQPLPALDRLDQQLQRVADGAQPLVQTPLPGARTSSWWQFSSGWVFSPLTAPPTAIEIRPIDRVSNVGGVGLIRAALVEQLARVGIDRTTARLWALSTITSDHLRGLFLREASGHAGNVSQKLTFGDRDAQYALIPVVHGVTDDGTSATFETGLQLEYSASAGVTAATTATFTVDANLRFGFSLVRETDAAGLAAGGGAHLRLGPSFNQALMKGNVQSLARSGGQAFKMDLQHTGRTADVRWRIIVVSARNLTESRRLDQHLGVQASATDVDVAQGLNFYAPERTTFTLADLETLLDPATAGTISLPALRKSEPRLLRADAEPSTGVQRFGPVAEGESERVVPMAPLSDTDPTLVPEYPLLPLNSVPEYLMARPGAESLSRVNPVLRAATDLIAQHAPGALTGVWQLQAPGISLRGGLDAMLAPQALNAQAPVLRAGGLLLTRVDGQFLGQRVTQLLIRLNRDPRGRGYLTTEGQKGGIKITNRGDERSGQNWSDTRTVNLTAGLTGIVDGAARPGLMQNQMIAELARGWNQGTGGSYAFAPFRYDAFEIKGDLSMLLGEVDLEVTLISVWRPSPLLNTIGLGAPMSLSRHVQNVTSSTPTGTSATVGQQLVPLGESVTVLTADLVRPLPAPTGEPIISRIAPGSTPTGAREISFTGEELQNKDVLVRIDPDKVRYLYDAWTKALSQHAGSPALLAAWGQIGQDELRALSDSSVLETHLLRSGTGAGGDQARLSVPLRSTGSVFTDTTGSLSVSFRLVEPKVSANFAAAQVKGKAEVMTAFSTPGGRQDVAGSARGGAPNTWFGANPQPSAQPLAIGAPMYSGRTRTQASGTQRAASNWDDWALNTEWYGPVYLDALVTITLRTSNTRDKIRYGGTELPLTFRVRNLVEAAWSPQRLVHDAGLGAFADTPVPIKVPSGWYLPADVRGSKNHLGDVQSFPMVDEPRVAIVHTAFRAPLPQLSTGLSSVPDSGVSVRAYGQDLSAREFAERYLVPIVQHDPDIRAFVLVTTSLPAGSPVLSEMTSAARLPTGTTITAVTGPSSIHTTVDARNTWEIATVGSAPVRISDGSMLETIEVVLGDLDLAALRPPLKSSLVEGVSAKVKLSESPLVAGLGDVAMLRSSGRSVFESARQAWLQDQGARAEGIIGGLPESTQAVLRDEALALVGRASGYEDTLADDALLHRHVVPITAALLNDAAQGAAPPLSEVVVQATGSMVNTLIRALGLQKPAVVPEPELTPELAPELTPEPEPAADLEPAGVERPSLEPADLEAPAVRAALVSLSGPSHLPARQTWWRELAELAEDVANGFEPIAVAPMSFVANSMVANRLTRAEGVSDLSDEAQSQLREELGTVLVAILLRAWSAQGGSGLPSRDVVQPVAALADDLMREVFRLTPADPNQQAAAPRPPQEVPEPQAPEPVVFAPQGHIAATGGDVLSAMLAGLLPGAQPSSPPSAASGTANDPQPELDVPQSPRPATTPEMEPGAVPHASLGTVGAAQDELRRKSDRAQPDHGSPASSFNASVTDALALLAPDLSRLDKGSDPTHRWDTVGPIAKRRKDEG